MKWQNILLWGLILLYILAPVLEYIDFEEMNLNPFDYARITDVDYKAVVMDEPLQGGNIYVTERLTFDIHAAFKSNLFWELWRDFPEDTVDGLKVDYDVLSVKQILPNGTEIPFDESSKLYWNDSDYLSSSVMYGPNKWFHSKGPYNESKRQYECLLLYVDGLYREKPVYEIEYIMNNASLRYADCSELYLSLYSEETIKHLNSFNAQILFPNENMPSTGNYRAYTYGTNSNGFSFTESDSVNPGYHTFQFNLDKSDLKFKPHNEYIEFSLISFGPDKHIFTQNAPRNYYSHENVLNELVSDRKDYENAPSIAFLQKSIMFTIMAFFTYLVVKQTSKIERNLKEKHNFYTPEWQMDYFRDIPSNLDPNFAAELVFCRHKEKKSKQDGYSAILLSLIRKEYIKLERIDNTKAWESTNVKIVLLEKPIINLVQFGLDELTENIKPKEPLTQSEKLYFDLIVKYSHGTEISMNDLKQKVSSDYENSYTFVQSMNRAIPNIGTTQGYFQKADYKEPQRLLKIKSFTNFILAFICLVFINLISYQTQLDFAFGSYFLLGFAFLFKALKQRKLSKKYLLLTQFGENEYVKWRGLYNFLNSETLMKERTFIELPIWEQYLVYATAFGISDKVIKALEIRCPDMEMSPMLSNPYYRSRNFYHYGRSFRSSAYHSSYSSSSYGGSYGGFSGHGYGGGGRGGGGGRRRSLVLKYLKTLISLFTY